MTSHHSQWNSSSQTHPLNTLNNFNNKTLKDSNKPSKSIPGQLSWLVSKYCSSTSADNSTDVRPTSLPDENLIEDASTKLGVRKKLKPDKPYKKQEEKLAKVHKKVKTQSIIDTDQPDSPSSSISLGNNKQESIQEDPPGFLNEDSIASTGDSVKSQENDSELSKEAELTVKKNVKLWKNIKVFYDENAARLCFKVRYVLDGESETRDLVLTRKEMVEYNPQILLYFYENHLHFPSDPEFTPEMLKKL